MRGKNVSALAAAVVAAAAIWYAPAQDKAKPAGGNGGGSKLLQRGEYLVTRVAMCGDCHTPRGAKGKPNRSRMLQGAMLPIKPKEKTDDWADMAPDITRGGLAGKWGEEGLVKLLTTGVDPDGKKALPPMPRFRLHKEDARAVAAYLRSLPGKKKGGK